jgi:hypothetical protein
MPDLARFSDPAALSVQEVLTSLGLAALLAFLIGWHYRTFGSTFSNRAKLAWILPAVALPTVLVISVVKASLALSLGLVGALSIVRFRTPVKEPEELAYIFLAIGVGLGMGADQPVITTVSVVFILGVLTVRAFFRKGSRYPNLYMNIELPAEAASEQWLKEIIAILSPHAQSVELRRFDVAGDRLEGTFYLDCRDIDDLVDAQEQLGRRFPGASVTFVEQSGVPGA